ncbi:dihydroorotate dehydrogenase electron transfer subunit [Desulfosoma caldarium]|uniref:Dihydroorotate oxidase B electron transfer subunit n=1 Tax=Desulfosoma caldarium TaxID=610254 RepID=A0A3N1UZE9_9BACT|nr:dihydroorotate dehydrogenase electron transfer subunit [Desulfosoma caldarium]ROQ93221.1 dihydroorotate oxidase B electron transfer subunit [Desulfosoma caldarium]
MPRVQEKAKILESHKEAEGTYRLVLYAPKIVPTARPGQFVMVRVASEGADPLLARPFSFHRLHKEDGLCEILLRVVGAGTRLLSQRQPGSSVDVVGPLGRGFTAPTRSDETVVFVAGGIGIAPLRALLDHLLATTHKGHPERLHLYYGARSASELIALHDLKRAGVVSVVSTDDGSAGERGTVLDAVQKRWNASSQMPNRLYACGSLPMQVNLARWVRRRDIWVEMSLESMMACGIGACLGCALPAVDPEDPQAQRYLHVCQDGPVLDPKRIRWDKVQPLIARPLISASL